MTPTPYHSYCIVAIALFERAANAIPQKPVFHRTLADPAFEEVLKATAQLINYQLV